MTIPNLEPSTSLATTGDYLFGQDAETGLISRWNIRMHAENSIVVPDSKSAIDDVPAVPGTSIVMANFPAAGGGYILTALYQTGGNDVTLSAQGKHGGEWRRTSIPIPPQ